MNAMQTLTIAAPQSSLEGRIRLAGSKSISNRALIIRALCNSTFPIDHLANARDTVLLEALLQQSGNHFNAEAAGTTFRFLTAYLSQKPGLQTLTGTERMKQRPIKVLAEALQKLGARIEYLEKEGYPPLRIGEPADFGQRSYLKVPAGISSQYISALLMLAPTLPNGLTLELDGKIVSRPYIEMTLRLMAHFGVQHRWEGQRIEIAAQAYQAQPFTVEADWSAASYYYAMTAMAPRARIQLDGLFDNSVQGDAVLAEMMTFFGVRTTYNESGILLEQTGERPPNKPFEWDFLRCPDLAQTLAVCCAALGVDGNFTGLETLRIKETDRIAALERELQKVRVTLEEGKPGWFHIRGQAAVEGKPRFATYEDHRMAMAFAPLALLAPIEIEEPAVVGKSYPDFWKDLQKLGYQVG
jgi:3-phosphoshikimate 1-carboxyvinyltransferase